jgi:hypothetical protein
MAVRAAGRQAGDASDTLAKPLIWLGRRGGRQAGDAGDVWAKSLILRRETGGRHRETYPYYYVIGRCRRPRRRRGQGRDRDA